MEQIKDGGPAFPHDDRAQWSERAGMTLRDYFAVRFIPSVLENNPHLNAFDCALYAYEMSDAMLRARDNRAAPEAASPDMLVALQEVLKTPGLQSGLQAMCAAAVSKALGVPIDQVLRGE